MYVLSAGRAMTSLRPPDALDQQGGDPAAAGRRVATGG
jgi:hypothetical protein